MSRRFAVNWFPETGLQHDQFYAYAEVYKDSLIVIINEINRNHNSKNNIQEDDVSDVLSNHDYGIIPAMFLFRHYIELQLKGMILQRGGKINDFNTRHGLDNLLQLLEERVQLPRISQHTRQFIAELARLDAHSQGFRYPYTREGRRFFAEFLEREMTQVNVMSEFSRRAEIIINDLENQEGDFDSEDDNKQNNEY